MTQIAILSGIYSKTGPDFVRSYPLNLVPYVEDTGLSKGYLRSAEGVREVVEGPGLDRGGIVWNGLHHRVMGDTLVSIDPEGVLTEIGTVQTDGLPVSFSYSFDRLAIASNRKLWYWNGSTLQQVTDPDLGEVVDMVWSDGYFMTTDGEYLVVTELNDPMAVDPLKYGSSEADPDPVNGLIVLRGRVHAINRYTIEAFINTGTTGFPFARQAGALIPKGAVGTQAKCAFQETFAFVGSGRGEAPSVYLAGSGQAVKISSRTVDDALAALSDEELALVALEARQGSGRTELFAHLPGQTFVYSYSASQALDLPVWYRLASGSDGLASYRPRNYTLAYGEWFCGDTTNPVLGVYDDTITTQFGEMAAWQFDTAIIYNSGNGAQVHAVELVTQAGRAGVGQNPVCFLSTTRDGLRWSLERRARLGMFGEREQRPIWRQVAMFRNWLACRFRGVIDTPVSFSRLEAQIEPLNA